MFRVEDAVSVDTSGFELVAPGNISNSPGVVLAVTERPQLYYDVRIRLRLGATLDLRVSPEKIGPPRRG
jgi:hypothetical protein